MKNRICLAWFGDLDAPDQGRTKSRPVSNPKVAPADSGPRKSVPKVKDAAELRRMFGRH
ncbi:hypothetical protein [Luteolibacter marinus]|uniref:hypothetical protein n=1 Tax=Luteolibacter marinus TaxID=2776705 RepID=UPI001868691C|nr:hypothetical protein [Luteolibacter marinus]